MTHELRVPRRVIKGFAEELRDATTLPEREPQNLGRILSAATQAQGLITSLLACGRLGGGAVRRRRLSLHCVVTSCLLGLQITIRGDHVTLLADPTLLKLALANLVTNALTFVPPAVLPILRSQWV
jgi:signal transduction histidine kinase